MYDEPQRFVIKVLIVIVGLALLWIILF